jgi:hypothetical protein
MAAGLNGPLQIRNPLYRRQPNSTKLISSGIHQGHKTHQKLVKKTQPKRGQHLGFVLVSLVCFVRFYSHRTLKNGSAGFDNLYVKQRGCMQAMSFGGSYVSKNFQWVHLPTKHTNVGPAMEISRLNKNMIKL